MLQGYRAPLQENDVFLLEGIENKAQYAITIEALAGMGASCLAYLVRYEFDGTTYRRILKECWSADNSDIYRNDEKTLVVNESARDSFAGDVERFIHAYREAAAFLVDNTDITNYVVKPVDLLQTPGRRVGYGTVYTLHDFDDGYSMDKKPPQEAYEVFALALSVARALRPYHSRGKIHIDLKPGNLFVFNNKEEEGHYQIKLFDLDAAVELRSLHQDEYYSFGSTEGWQSPEMLAAKRKNTPENRGKIGVRSDFYLTGFLVDFYLQTFFAESSQSSDWSADMTAPMLKYVDPKIAAPLKLFFERTMSDAQSKRYQTDDELIVALEELRKIAEATVYINPQTFSAKEGFFGREDELNRMREVIGRRHHVFLCGMGGIGKSELALKYTEMHQDDYDNVLRVTYNGNLAKTLANSDLLVNYQYYGENEEEKFEFFISNFSTLCTYRTALIIDNFDTPDDPVLKRVLAMPCTIIVTSRYSYRDSGYGFVPVEEAPIDILKDIFYANAPEKYRQAGANDAEIDKTVEELITTVGKHTMTVELMARQLRAKSGLTLQGMLARLQESGVDTDYEEEIEHHKDGEPPKTTAYGHIKRLFDFSGMVGNRDNAAEIRIIKLLTFVPPEGIAIEDVLACARADDNALNALERGGWIKKDDVNDTVALHPVMSTVLWKEFNPSVEDEEIRDYLSHIMAKIADANVPIRQIAYLPLVVYAGNRMQEEVVAATDFLEKSGNYCDDMARHEQALVFDKRSLAIREKILPPYHSDIANSLVNVSRDYRALGEKGEMIKYAEKALAIAQEVPDPEQPRFAAIYNHMGIVCAELLQWEKALEYFGKAIQIAEKAPNPNFSNLASFYSNRGGTYGRLGQYQQALEDQHKALAIRKGLPEPRQLDLAMNLNNLGNAYQRIGQYGNALVHHQEALRIHQESLPPNHPDLRESYNNIGTNYRSLEEYDKSLDCLMKGLAIARRISPVNYSRMGRLLENIGITYSEINQNKKALVYCKQALTVMQKGLLPDVSGIANIYCDIGLIHGRLEEYKQAMEYQQMALEMRRGFLPLNHPDMAVSYNNIGTIHHGLKQYEKALAYYKRAYICGKKSLMLGHPHMMERIMNMGNVYAGIDNSNRAIHYYKEALKGFQSSSLPGNRSRIAKINQQIHILSIQSEREGSPYNASWKELPQNELLLIAEQYEKEATNYEKWGAPEGALQYYLKALNIWEFLLAKDDEGLAGLYNEIYGIYDELDNPAAALDYCQLTIAVREKKGTDDDTDLIALVENYKDAGDYCLAMEIFDDAAAYYRKAWGLGTPHYGVEDNYIRNMMNNLVQLYQQLKNPEEVRFFEELLTMENEEA